MNSLFFTNVSGENGKFVLENSLKPFKGSKGLFGYQWTVQTLQGEKRVLSGITDNPYQRLSTYIAEFNRQHVPHKIIAGKPSLHELVHDPVRQIAVEIFAAEDHEGAKELEQRLIHSVPEQERLNRTDGGNGGSSWSQYDDFPPSQATFAKVETPVKYYPLKRCEKGPITVELTPSFKKGSAIYSIKKLRDDKENVLKNGEEDRYIGMSTEVRARVRTHLSLSSKEEPSSKFHRALCRSPEKWGVGVLPSTVNLSPRSLRSAERHHIDRLAPSMNSKRGGGGPAPLKK